MLSESKSLPELDAVPSSSHIRMLPAGSARVEGKNLLKQRNALQRVSGTSSSFDARSPMPRSSPSTPDVSPMLSRSAGRRSFKASLFRMIGSGRAVTPDGTADDGLLRAHSTPAVNSLSVSDGTARARSPSPADRKTKKKDKDKKEKKKAKKEKEKDKDKERKSSFPLWASSGKRGQGADLLSPVTVSPPGEATDDGRPKSHSVNVMETSAGDDNDGYSVIPPSAAATTGPPRTESPKLSNNVPSTMNRMQERPMGLGLSEKPSKKPKPVLAAQNSHHVSRKPAKAPKPNVVRSKSACSSAVHRIGDTTQPAFNRPLITRNDATSSSESDPSRENTPSPDTLSFPVPARPVLGPGRHSSDSSEGPSAATSTSAEATAVCETGLDDGDRLVVCPGTDDDSTCQVSPMLYQTWQVVSNTPETDPDRDSHMESPSSPVRPPKARKPTLGEEQLRRMHTSIRNSARRHNHKNLRWEEQPKVRNSMAMPEMSKEEKQLQQRYFEVISSERSYNQSMKVLVSHFMESEDLSGPNRLITAQTHHSLFSNAKLLLDVSNRFLEDLEGRLQENVLISTVCDVIKRHVEVHFDPFVVYCSNQAYQMKTLEDVLKSNVEVRKAVSDLEKAKEAQRLPMVSFLLLPMQRVTRLKLLVDGMLNLVPIGSGLYALTKETLDTLKGCVNRCNEGAKAMKRTEELIEINNQIDFGKLRPIALVSHKASRWLLRSGAVNLIHTEKKNKTSEVHLIVFNDLLIIAKYSRKKPMYRVIDHCNASFLEVDRFASPSDLAPPAGRIHRSSSDSALFKLTVNNSNTLQARTSCTPPPESCCMRLTLLENSARQTKEYFLEARSMTEKTRWLEALSPNEDDSEDRIYEAWDCPEVTAVHQYIAQQPDELSMDPGDGIRVLKKMRDGWYQGQSIRTNDQGWFPESYVKERETEHSRARHLRLQHRLARQSERTSNQPGSARTSPDLATVDD